MEVRKIYWSKGTIRAKCEHPSTMGPDKAGPCFSYSKYKVDGKYMCPLHAAFTVLRDAVKGHEELKL